jgi:asparagine synthase (glutamine-hydrolysing)
LCGISGFWLTRAIDTPEAVLKRMTAALLHRGPDGGDHWLDTAIGVGFGHRRLAIVDLSDAGKQPMHSRSGRFVVIFNGEIYNFQKLRAELEPFGATFRGHSDTEVMLAAFEHWGVEGGVRRLAGMFALAVWDKEENALYLVRDRLGKKPLYYSLINGNLVFGSELKALREFPGFDPAINRDALALYMRHNYVPGPWSIYRNVKKLPPATSLRVSLQGSALALDSPREYWSARALYENAEPRVHRDDAQMIDELDVLLRDAVATRMVADVPLGAFLSGGVDSSLIVALMQAQSSRRVDTFTIGFNEELYDEAPHAKEVARHLGTNHSEVYVTAEEARATIPLMARMFDEPFADSSQIPTYLVSKIARRQATVALSGDGGDELFCGYRRYFKWRRVWEKMQRIPRPMQQLAAIGIRAFPPGVWNAVSAPIMKLRRRELSARSVGEKLYKLAPVLGSGDPGLLYREFVTHWDQPDTLVKNSSEPATIINAGGGPCDTGSFMQHMMMLDILTYLPDDILAKVDRTSMAVSLETRAPLLDHRIVEFAAALPLEQKVRNGESKWLLRRLLEKYVPRALFERPKMGFGIPIDSWLRGPLRGWAEDLMSETRLRREGYFDPVPIRALWLDHLAGKTDAQYLLWDVLMFQAWLDDVHSAPVRS